MTQSMTANTQRVIALSIVLSALACGASTTDSGGMDEGEADSGGIDDSDGANVGEADTPSYDAESDGPETGEVATDADDLAEGGEDGLDAGQDVPEAGDEPDKPGCVDPTNIGLAKWGDMHVHSTNSDGDFAPHEMMQAAKDQGADFVWITDHSRSFQQTGSGPLTPAEFASCMSAGASKTTASFLARCGIEWRLGYQSQDEKWHGVMLGMTPSQFPGHFDVESYTSWNKYLADMDGGGTVALITHPTGPASWNLGNDSGRNTDPEANGELDVYELNGDGTVVSRINYFFDWLNAGWKVSPVYDTDMHHSKWTGVEGPKCAGAWIKDGDWNGKQWPALRAAIRAHRTFANYPGKEKNYIRLVSLNDASEPECMMGSTLPIKGEPLRLEIHVNAPKKQWHFRIFTNHKSSFANPLASAAPADTTLVGGKEQRWRPTIDTTGVKWIAVVATRASGAPTNDDVWLVSAPLWIGDP